MCAALCLGQSVATHPAHADVITLVSFCVMLFSCFSSHASISFHVHFTLLATILPTKFRLLFIFLFRLHQATRAISLAIEVMPIDDKTAMPARHASNLFHRRRAAWPAHLFLATMRADARCCARQLCRLMRALRRAFYSVERDGSRLRAPLKASPPPKGRFAAS